MKDNDFMKQCKIHFHFFIIVKLTSFFAVYKVHWLKARAWADRWEEEFQLVYSEMDWTLRYFQHQGGMWVQWTQKSLEEEKMGHAAYAARQDSMWAKFYQQARGVFLNAKALYPM